MLLRLEVKNWKSFRDATALNMVADSEIAKHTSRLIKTDTIDEGILPVAAVFGGNAAGKSNFFSAISFIHRMVLKSAESDDLIDVQPFRLDIASNSSPCSFSLDVISDGIVWRFEFTVDSDKVIDERLFRCDRDGMRHMLYSRSVQASIVFGDEYKGDELSNLRLLEKGTNKNQLFVNNTLSQKFPAFQSFGKWFVGLLLLEPESHPISLSSFVIDKSSYSKDIKEHFIQWLRNLDTGISQLSFIPSSLEDLRFSSLQEKKSVLSRLEKIKDGETVFVTNAWRNYTITKSRKAGEIVVEKLVATHLDEDGKEVPFDMQDESSGTLRLIDLLPALIELTYKNDGTELTLIIDEIDRGLHVLATRELIKEYLRHRTPQSRSQLLFTTHDILLLDSSLFRKDEIYFAERDKTGASNLVSLNEYEEANSGEDIRVMYLQGYFGGVPLIQRNDSITMGGFKE